MTERGIARAPVGAGIALATFALLAFPPGARAQDGPFAGTTLEVAGHGGIMFFDEGGTQPAVGARVAIRLANGIGFGAAADRADREIEIEDDPVETEDAETWFYAGELSYTIPSATRANFFGFVGLGRARFEPSPTEESQGIHSEDHLLIPLGLGMIWYNHPYDPWWALRAEFRDHIVHADEDETIGVDDVTTNNYQVSLGLALLLGGGPQPAD